MRQLRKWSISEEVLWFVPWLAVILGVGLVIAHVMKRL